MTLAALGETDSGAKVYVCKELPPGSPADNALDGVKAAYTAGLSSSALQMRFWEREGVSDLAGLALRDDRD